MAGSASQFVKKIRLTPADFPQKKIIAEKNLFSK
jgi:hypothetical protein